MPIEKIVYNGKSYSRIKGKWVDKNYISVPHMQRALDAEYYKSLDLDNMTMEEVMAIADEFKDNESADSASSLYNSILSSSTGPHLVGLLSKLSSCYRKIGKPQSAIELYEEVKKNYGENPISSAFLTSVGAAYCDLEKYEEAKRFADKAYAKSGGKGSPELSGLYGRIRKETTGSGKYDG